MPKRLGRTLTHRSHVPGGMTRVPVWIQYPFLLNINFSLSFCGCRSRKRRQVACRFGQRCRDNYCQFYHPPKCFFGRKCWHQPNCWFDHTRGPCKFGESCYRPNCHFSHRYYVHEVATHKLPTCYLANDEN